MAPPTAPSTDDVHPTSLVHEDCIIGQNVKIGPFCYIGPDVVIGEHTHLMSNVTILSSTRIGSNCTIYPYTVLGAAPQSSRPAVEGSMTIGNNTVIREFVSIHNGTAEGDSVTRIGNRCQLMAQVHVGHDCQLEEGVILVTGVGLAGHVYVGRNATVAGQAGVQQRCRIGQMAYVAGGSKVTKDVLPFSTVSGDRARTIGHNFEGLHRHGWSEERMATVAAAVAQYLKHGLDGIKTFAATEDILRMEEFVEQSVLGICAPKPGAVVRGAKL
jgi:UDP-N-acetylglucosamine acyltransferase